MFLSLPQPKYTDAFKRLVAEYRLAGETERVTKYAAGETDFSAYLEFLASVAEGRTLPENCAPYHTFWMIQDEDILGVARVRPKLDLEGERYHGHIGYDVLPSQRNKGYGTALLRMTLLEARHLGLNRVVLTCQETNLPSRRVLLKCGAQLIEVIPDLETSFPLCRFEIEL
ncbi:GNAT family N-acetyltransferase [Pedosphaera parvula]|uniref:GCN5-related N-acetyltransferase n=1 Tax=Pedosphaera parvula (strain Ellin514) TaxID=320771 RepID=B9XPE2_PEDPL|nr:GNAT family N-acetyltransferase [Pedosphaera parvula]EEF58282.1 GCN5-related N-acetyltransferase [Pedosphaera parvula Ellin514]